MVEPIAPLYGEQRQILKATFMRTESELGRSLRENMKKELMPKKIFSPSFKLELSGFDNEMGEEITKISKHHRNTFILIMVSVVILASIGFPLRDKGTDIISEIPLVIFLVLFVRYLDLFKKIVSIMTKLDKKANQSSEPTRYDARD